MGQAAHSPTEIFKRATASTLRVIAAVLPVFLAAAGAHSAPMRCVFQVKGHTYINGPCNVTKDPDGSLQFSSSESNYFGSVNASERGGPHGYWNGEEAASHGQNSLGAITHVADCWINRNARICISQPKRTDIPLLPPCGDVAQTVEKMMERKTGDFERHIINYTIEYTTKDKRTCTGMFAENFVDEAALTVRYEITAAKDSGYAVRILSVEKLGR
jgi:hypothetical protein